MRAVRADELSNGIASLARGLVARRRRGERADAREWRVTCASPARATFAALVLALAACSTTFPNVVPLEFTTPGDRASGELGGMIVPIEIDGRPAKLAIDTGSARTFLYLHGDALQWIEEHALVRIGHEQLMLPGRNLGPQVETDEGIVGVLGADFFLARPTTFDPSTATITRHASDARSFDGVSELAYEDVEQHVIVRLRADGESLRLMWDTGCPHLLWIGRDGRDGDEEHIAEDVEGSQFPMYAGKAEVEIADEPARTLTTLRAPRFPYFEGTVRALGGGIDGLAGQSVFGWRRMMFDPKRRVIVLGPRD